MTLMMTGGQIMSGPNKREESGVIDSPHVISEVHSVICSDACGGYKISSPMTRSHVT